MNDRTHTIEHALEIARQARERAYAPYSGFRVGAAIKARGHEQIYGGCNVENASYGATICAERGAVMSMVADMGHAELDFVLVVTDADPLAVPCAICLQVLAQFSSPRTEVLIANLDEVRETYTMPDLLPHPFQF
ncbi:MAG: cytidine deaminase [Spirochaetaceae bacterium]